MVSTPSTTYSTAAGENKPVILLSVHDSENCRLIQKFLPQSLSVEINNNGIGNKPFDLCILDEQSYQTNIERLQNLQAQTASILLPILLLTKRRAGNDPAVFEFVDDVVYTPVSGTTMLQLRVQKLLRQRNYALKLEKENRRLKKENKKYRLMTENSIDMVSRHAPDGTYLDVSQASNELTGYLPEELVGKNIFENIHPTDKTTIENSKKLLATKDVVKFSFQVAMKEGSYKWVETTMRPILSRETGQLTEIYASTRDISERKEYEDRLKKEKIFTDTVINSMPIFFYMLDEDLNLVQWNKKLEKSLGYTSEEFRILKPNVYPEREREFVLSKYREIFEKGEAEMKVDVVNKKGEIRHHFITGKKFISGDRTFILGNGIDITEQEETLKQLQERVKEQACLRNIANLNEQVLSAEELLEKAVHLLPKGWQFPEITEAAIEFDGIKYQTENYGDTEWNLRSASNRIEGKPLLIKVVYLEERNFAERSPFLKEERQLIDTVAETLSLQLEKIISRIKLEDSERRWELLVQENPGLVQIMIDDHIQFINPAGAHLYGIDDPAALIGKKWSDVTQFTEADRREIKDRIDQVIKGEAVDHPEVYKTWTPENEVRYVELQSVKVKYKGEKALMTIGQNVTERVQYEKELKETNQQLETAQGIAKLGYWFHDIAENRSEWSAQMYNIWEVNPDTFTPNFKTFFETIHPEDKLLFENFLQVAFPTHDYSDTEHRIITPEGKIKWILERITLHRDENENPKMLEGTAQDITEQKKKEKVIREALKEKEVLLQEVHHRVKNNLAVISGLLQIQRFNSDDVDTNRIIRNSERRIKSIALIHEKIYQSETLSEVPFRSYIHDLTASISDTMDIKDNINMHLECEIISLNVNQAVPCGIIVSELLTNALEHAFTDTDEGKIWITIGQEGDKIRITVKDNGAGMPDEILKKGKHSMGYTIIKTLFKQLNADFNIEIENGVLISFSFKKRAVKGSSSAIT